MAITQDEIACNIEKFVRTEFRISENDRLFSRDAHLFDLGFVDSTGAVELISFIESTFGIALDDDQLFSEEFTTINGISRLVSHRLASRTDGTDDACVKRLSPSDSPQQAFSDPPVLAEKSRWRLYLQRSETGE